jgi:hypothetical protein
VHNSFLLSPSGPLFDPRGLFILYESKFGKIQTAETLKEKIGFQLQ